MTWSHSIEQLRDDTRKIAIDSQGNTLSFSDVVEGWVNDTEFIHYFSSILKDLPFDAYFWEMPPLNTNNLDREFECVVIDSPALDKMPVDRVTFKEYFLQSHDTVVAFDNLGGDAHLVVPRPNDSRSNFPHLAAFMRSASDVQIELFWNRVGQQIEKYVDEDDMWISTAGSGVGWLHLRLDSYPKYYSYSPYRVRCS